MLSFKSAVAATALVAALGAGQASAAEISAQYGHHRDGPGITLQLGPSYGDRAYYDSHRHHHQRCGFAWVHHHRVWTCWRR